MAKLKHRITNLLVHVLRRMGIHCIKNLKQASHQYINDLDRHFSAGDVLYIVYQYGKSGSRTVYATLANNARTVLHCHYLNPEHLAIAERLMCHVDIPAKFRSRRFIKNTRSRLYATRLRTESRPLKVVTTVREPEAYLKSVYFAQQWLFEKFIRNQYGEYNAEVMNKHFEETLSGIEPWLEAIAGGDDRLAEMTASRNDIDVAYMAWMVHGYMNWFDEELGRILDIKPDDLTPVDNYWTYSKGSISGVVVRAEDLDRVARPALRTLCDESIESIEYRNIAVNKQHGDFYRHLKANGKVPQSILQRVRSSWHVRMFYEPPASSAIRIN